MNSFKPITGAADSISAPHSRGGSAPNAAPLPGAADRSPVSAEPQSGGAAAPIAPKQPCLACDNKGEREWLSLDETEWRWHICEDCDGTGYAKKPYCEICRGNLTADLFCVSCDDWASLVYVERIAPGRVAV